MNPTHDQPSNKHAARLFRNQTARTFNWEGHATIGVFDEKGRLVTETPPIFSRDGVRLVAKKLIDIHKLDLRDQTAQLEGSAGDLKLPTELQRGDRLLHLSDLTDDEAYDAISTLARREELEPARLRQVILDPDYPPHGQLELETTFSSNDGSRRKCLAPVFSAGGLGWLMDKLLEQGMLVEKDRGNAFNQAMSIGLKSSDGLTRADRISLFLPDDDLGIKTTMLRTALGLSSRPTMPARFEEFRSHGNVRGVCLIAFDNVTCSDRFHGAENAEIDLANKILMGLVKEGDASDLLDQLASLGLPPTSDHDERRSRRLNQNELRLQYARN